VQYAIDLEIKKKQIEKKKNRGVDDDICLSVYQQLFNARRSVAANILITVPKN
jgi:hypothetical protein